MLINIHRRQTSFFKLDHFKINCYKFLYSCLLISVLLSCQSKEEEIQLLLNLPIDHEQIIIHTTETTGSLLTLKYYKEVNLKLISSHNNIYKFSVDVINIKSENTVNAESEIYDSSMPVSQMTESELKLHEQYQTILASVFHISVDKYGNVIKQLSFPNGKASPEGVFEFTDFQIIFPYKKTSVGSKWESERKNPINSQPIKINYELKHISDDKVYIGARHIIPSIQTMLNSNTQYGDYILDRHTGALIKGSLKMNLQTGGTVTRSFYPKE